MFLIGRSLIIVIAITVLFSVLVLYGARHIHGEVEGFVEARLQSDLITHSADYRRAILDLEEASMLFVGDIMLSRGVLMMMERNNDYTYPFLLSAEKTIEADIAFGNLEGPISGRGANQGSEYSFRAKPEAVEGLALAGFDVMSVANNHIYDWGADAVRDTVSILKSKNIQSAGAGENFNAANAPTLLAAGSAKVAFLAYTNLYPESLEARENTVGISDLNNAIDAVKDAKKNADIVVVSLHWGDEYSEEPNSAQKELGRALIDAGANMIVGHHPHVVQGVEEYGGGWIVYSLGNFVFDQGFSDETMTGMAIKARVSGRRIVGIDKIEVKISKTFQPTFVNL